MFHRVYSSFINKTFFDVCGSGSVPERPHRWGGPSSPFLGYRGPGSIRDHKNLNFHLHEAFPDIKVLETYEVSSF